MAAGFWAAVILLTGCTPFGGSAPELSDPETVPSARAPGGDCPTPVGQACLGALTGGTYTTSEFRPRLTYTVPDGWSNFDDTRGIVHLVPAEFTPQGINAGTSDYIGVYSSVVPSADCDSAVPGEVARTPAAFADWFGQHPGLVVEGRHDVTLGGLDGVVVDLRVAPDWTQACPFSNGEPVVAYLSGSSPSSFDHSLTKGQVVRLYLLLSGTEVLGIEAVDVDDAQHLDAYSSVVDTFEFDDSSDVG
jgi:hypothetical protein